MRYLVVGLGNIGGRRRALLGERCVATADAFNEAAQYRSVRDVPTGDFDAAVLAIPDDDKIDLVTYLLEQGKHVLVEKPLPLPDEATARRLEALARERGVILYTAYNHRFEPLLSAFQEQVAAGTIGEVYHGRLFYGNGTVKHVAGTWRDQGLGVIQDLGCHLLDLLAYVGQGGGEMRLVAAQSIESKAPDRALIVSADGRFTLEVMYHAWRNSFAFELYGELGSIHCFGLRKWGGSELIVRLRVLPSGRPYEGRLTDEGPDETWDYEIRNFESRIKDLEFERSIGDLADPNADCQTDLSTDWWIARTLRSLEVQLPVPRVASPS